MEAERAVWTENSRNQWFIQTAVFCSLRSFVIRWWVDELHQRTAGQTVLFCRVFILSFIFIVLFVNTISSHLHLPLYSTLDSNCLWKNRHQVPNWRPNWYPIFETDLLKTCAVALGQSINFNNCDAVKYDFTVWSLNSPYELLISQWGWEIWITASFCEKEI